AVTRNLDPDEHGGLVQVVGNNYKGDGHDVPHDLPRQRRVVAAVTTTPKRLSLLKPCLDSLLLQQSRPLDAVYVFIPWRFNRNAGQKYELPEWLGELTGIGKEEFDVHERST
ncbi:unnamed protein product, partial [Amoebophrya sp. A25]